MPKVSKVGKFRKVAAAARAESSDKDGPQGLSRGQRKRQAKRDQYLQREKMILSSLMLKREEEQKKRIDGFDNLKKALLETEETKVAESTEEAKSTAIKSNKSRKNLVAKEVTQMNLVMQHPAFKADPFATIRQHLQNILSKDVEQQKKQAEDHLKERRKLEEEKKAAKKESGAKKKRSKFKATRSKAR